MKSFRELSIQANTPSFLKETYKILQDGCPLIASDTANKPGSHSLAAIDSIQGLAYEAVKANLVKDNVPFRTLAEVRNSIKQNMAKDGFFNPMSNINTQYDSGYYNDAFIPTSMGPMEATAEYASGGLPQLIIDKKAKSVLLNGYQFESKQDYWTHDKLSRLKEYSDSTSFANKLVEAMRDGFIYGGATLYPSLKRDDVNSYRLPMRQLIKQGILTKESISHWVSVDRWNTVVIPDYNITVRDYLFAKSYYIPIAGIAVNTDRSAIIRPKELPYWGAIRQLGWGTSDYEGYVKSILSYQIMIASIPIMAQQMSLLLHEIPLDGIIAQNGKQSAEQFMEENDQQMRSWSMNNPKTINSFGKVYAIDRNYAGYNELGLMLRQDIAAQSGIPESVLFHTQPKGFSNNTEEVLLKQSEIIRMTQNSIRPMLRSAIEILAISCFGPDEDLLRNLQYLEISFETPLVATETERSESAARYAAALSSLVQSGVPVKSAVNLLKQFFREVEISGDFEKEVADREEENRKIKEEERKTKERDAQTDVTEKKHTDGVMNKKNNVNEAAKNA